MSSTASTAMSDYAIQTRHLTRYFGGKRVVGGDCRDDVAVHMIRLRTIVLIAMAALVLGLLTDRADLVGVGGDAMPALAVGALLASVAGLCALMLAFRGEPGRREDPG